MPNLSTNLQKEMNIQIQEELFSAYLYYSMAGWFEEQNLPGFAHWLKVQVLEEMTHAHRFYLHLIERRGKIELLEIKKPQTEWKSCLDAFEAAFAHEEHITERIHFLVSIARDEKDFAADTGLLQWFIKEQIEEETNTDAVVQKLKMIGNNKEGIYLLDQEMMARIFTPPIDAPFI
jgi:ferritin